jgi:hypothetical protein
MTVTVLGIGPVAVLDGSQRPGRDKRDADVFGLFT